MRINKLLSNYGVCSRKEANKIIEEGRVRVNGELAIKGQWVEEKDKILLDNERLEPKEKIYIILNKPVGIICTLAKDVNNNILEYMKYPDYIFPVGRLDKDSQGLIILTNDGDLANMIIEAENNHEKEYIVTVDKEYDDEFINKMSNGVDIGGVVTRPCKLRKINGTSFSIILTQGLNRQIRKMSKHFGYNVVKLERIRIMNIKIDGLQYGKWRTIKQSEIEELKKKLTKQSNNKL